MTKRAQPQSSNDGTRSLPDISNPPKVHQAETISPTPAARATVAPEKAAQPPSQTSSQSPFLPAQLPASFGRYKVVRLLGQGGMLNQRGEPVIMDFGLARRGNRKDAPLTQYGSVMGTPAYMAPEQAKGNPDEMGPACDVYSLGVILYELLAGRPPFEGDAIAVLSQLLMDEPKPPSKYRPDLDRKLEAICVKAMAKRPEARYRSMGDLATALGEYLKATGSSTQTPAAQNQPAGEVPLIEMMRELEPQPGAGPMARPDFHISRSSGQRFVTQQQEEPDAADTTAFVRIGRATARRKVKFPSWLWIASAAAAALVLAGVVILVRTEYGTIQIELSDSNATIEVKVDGDTIDITGLAQPLRLKPGKHNILVQGKDFETCSESFTVKEGDNPVMQVKLLPKPKVATAGPIPPPATATEPPRDQRVDPVQEPSKPVARAEEPKRPPADARAFNGHSYKFYAEKLSWKEAKRRCEAMGGHPVIIDSIEENAFVANLVSQAGWLDAWIGTTDEAQEGRWVSVNGQPLVYTNWYPGQPNNKNNEEHYALMSNRTFGNTALKWQWSDQPNESTQHQPGFVCEWDSAATAAGSPSADEPVRSVASSRPLPPPSSASPAKSAARQLVLFDGKDLSAWTHADRQPPKWKVANGYFEIAGGGNLMTREEFDGDHEIHVEFWIPQNPPNVKGQKRGNSGVFVQGRYEIQILDSYGANPPTKQDCGALYGQAAPLVNACKPPGAWQAMDITFHAPKLDNQGNVSQKPRLSVILNGNTVLNDVVVEAASPGAANPAMNKSGPLLLQDHGNPVRFRNIWVKSEER